MQCLLSAIDAHLGGGPRHWSDLTIVRNVGPLGTRAPLHGDYISNRGCNALLAGATAGADQVSFTHFMKLRPAFDAGFERECEMNLRLAAAAATADLVPRSTTFVANGVRVLVQDYFGGVSLERLIMKDPRRWASRAGRALGAARPVLDHIAASELPPDSPDRDGALRQALCDLVQAGLPAPAAAGLAARLASLAPVRRPQHGDFWPRNLLVASHGGAGSAEFRVIDYESVGLVDLPLYDVFHLVRSAGEVAGGWRGDWLRRWVAASAGDDRSLGLAAVCKAEIERQLPSATRPQIEAALLAHLVDVAARMHRRGLSRERLAGRFSELTTIGRWLDQGMLRHLLD